MPLKLHPCFIEQTSSLAFERVGCDAIHLVQQKIVATSRFALLDSQEHQFVYAFSLETSRLLERLQHELHHELLDHILELLFRSLLVGSSKLVCLAHANKHVALLICSDNCERLPTQ